MGVHLKLLTTGQSEVGWHRHEALLLCPQKYAYSYVLKRPRGAPQAAPFLGTLVHVGLAHFYLHLGLDQRAARHGSWARWTEAIQMYARESPEGLLVRAPEREDSMRKALAILAVYGKTYGRADSVGFEVVKVEHEIRVEIDGALYTQRADLIVKNKRDGKVYIWDHKTAGGFGLSYGAQQYTLSGQILGLHYLGQKLYGMDFGGVVLNMIGTKRAGDFERVHAGAAPDSQRRWIKTLRYARERIAAFSALDPLEYPRALNSTVCFAYGGCDYYDSCRWGSTTEEDG